MNEVKDLTYKDYDIIINEFPDDDYPSDKTYGAEIYSNGALVYQGDDDIERLYDAIDIAKQVIDDYENSAETVSDWHNYYGVKEGDFA